MKKEMQPTKRVRLKFIDRLEAALKEAGVITKRGGMEDYSIDKNGKRSEGMDDNCEWVTIILKNEDESKKYEVEFYFDKNATHLESVNLYIKKKKKGYGGGLLVATHKPKDKVKPEPATRSPLQNYA